MRKKFKIFIIACMAVSLLAGCGEKAKIKQPGDSRINQNYYTFTGDEFKNYFNEAIGSGSKLDEFKGKKLDGSSSNKYVGVKHKEEDDRYIYIEHADKYMIIAKSQKENGQLLEVSIDFGGGKETKNGSFSEVKYTKDEIKGFKKYASAIFDVCEPNVETKQFEEFFDKCFGGGSIPTTQEKEIGDLKITLVSREEIEMTFVPKTQKFK